jgi:hypothetical protein
MSTANTPSVGQNSESTLRLGQVIGSFKLPVALTLGIVLLSFVPRIAGTPLLQWSFWGAAAALALWQGFMLLHLARRPALKDFSSAVYSQHYVQAMVQFSVYLYWGYYWRPVYDHLWLLAGQVLFALHLRHAARLVAAPQLPTRLWPDPHYFQHQSVSLVPRRVVLHAVRDDRCRFFG